MRKRRGAPPPNLTGGQRVRALNSPWWDSMASRISSDPSMVGRTMTIEELTSDIASYPDGRRVRSRTVSRRLSHILELVERGPNGSRGRGATYRILPSPGGVIPPPERGDVTDVVIGSDKDWLLAQVERMTKGK